MRTLARLGILFSAAALAGCGNNATAVPQQPAAPREIFISSRDCAEAGTLTLDECGQAIDRAVAVHEKQAPSYKSLRACVAASGPDRCSQGVDGNYRVNLQAFMVTMGKPARAVPLYPTNDGSVGFRGIEKETFKLADDSYTVSSAAQAVAHENAKLAKKAD